jgi:RNA polymerase sigma factor (TIGR02999 family)
MVQSSPSVLTELLGRWRAGDETAFDALAPLIYGELRRIARRYLRYERPNHSLQSTALVHEAYIRLMRQGTHDFQNRAHFFAISAQLMRQILVEYARHRKALKRDGGPSVTIDNGVLVPEIKEVGLIALDDAMEILRQLDPRQSRIVELKFFGGLTSEEISVVLGISTATVKREWATARVWLRHEMRRALKYDT